MSQRNPSLLAPVSTDGGSANDANTEPPSKGRVLIAPGSGGWGEMVELSLRDAGFEVIASPDGAGALNLTREVLPDALVLDWEMSGLTGLEVCRTLKANAETAQTGVILLTARHQESDRVRAFEAGADDCLVKPISPRELVLRVRNILKRAVRLPPRQTVLKVGEITLAFDRHSVSAAGTTLELTAIEFRLLAALMEHRHQTLSRAALLTKVWKLHENSASRTVDTHIRRLRDKLGRAGEQIRTLRGFGYRLDGDVVLHE